LIPGKYADAGAGTRILVVEDNADSAETLARLLELSGHEVRVARDGPEAIAAALSWRPAFVLLDLGLPAMDGCEVAIRLRREAACRECVLIAVTGYGQPEDRRRSRAAGIDHHLLKPVDPEVLLALLARAGAVSGAEGGSPDRPDVPMVAVPVAARGGDRNGDGTSARPSAGGFPAGRESR
jgi:CheY-like chemotaxis protein